MTLTEKLLKRLPKKYHHLVKKLEAEDGLIDNCPYMLYFADGVAFAGYEDAYCFPVKSITEAVKFIREDCSMSKGTYGRIMASLDNIFDELYEK